MNMKNVVVAVATVSLAASLFAAPKAKTQVIAECQPKSNMENRNSKPGRGPGPFGDYWWANRFLSRLELGKKYKGKTVDVVMIGDSITHFWEWHHPKLWDKFTSGRTVINCGYGMDRTQQVLWRLDHGEIDGYTAKNVVIMIGTNNSSDYVTTPENLAAAIQMIAEKVRAKQPKAKIILHGIFPRGDSPNCHDWAGDQSGARRKNDKTNAILKKFAEERKDLNIFFYDIGEKFCDETGWVPLSVMDDHLHPTAKGYEIWMEALVPVLAK